MSAHCHDRKHLCVSTRTSERHVVELSEAEDGRFKQLFSLPVTGKPSSKLISFLQQKAKGEGWALLSICCAKDTVGLPMATGLWETFTSL